MEQMQDGLFSITAEKVVTLKEAIEAAKRDASEVVLGKLTPLHSISASALKNLLETVDEAFENQEWFDCLQIYAELVEEWKLGPSRNLGRYALCLVRAADFSKAIEMAQLAYELVPQEPSSYEALALYTAENGKVLEATRWLSLAVAAAGQKYPQIEALSSDLSRQLAVLKTVSANTFKYFQRADLIETLHKPHCRALMVQCDSDLLVESIKRVQEKPLTFVHELESNPPLLALARTLHQDPDLIFPPDFDDLHTEYQQEDSPLHHLDRSLFLRIARHLNLVAVSRLRQSCRLLSHWGNHYSYWQTIFCHHCDPLPDVDWGVALEKTFWRKSVQSVRCDLESIKALYGAMCEHPDQHYSPSFFGDVLSPIKLKFDSYVSDTVSCSLTAVYLNLVTLVDMGSTKTVQFILHNSSLLDLLVFSMARIGASYEEGEYSCLTMLTLIMSSGLGNAILNTLNSMLYFRASGIVMTNYALNIPFRHTLMAVAAAVDWVTELQPKRILPDPFQVASVQEASRSVFWTELNGVYETVLFLDSYPDHDEEAEYGIARCEFHVDRSVFYASGTDTVSDWEITDAQYTPLDGVIEFTRVFNKRKFRFSGCANPYGFGGDFREITAIAPSDNMNNSTSARGEYCGTWAWMRSKKEERNTNEYVDMQMETYRKQCKARKVHPTEYRNSIEAQRICRVSFLIQTEALMMMPGTTKRHIQGLLEQMGPLEEGVEIENLPLARFYQETDSKYALRKHVHNRIIDTLQLARTGFLEQYMDELLADAKEMQQEWAQVPDDEEENGAQDANPQNSEEARRRRRLKPVTRKWNRRFVSPRLMNWTETLTSAYQSLMERQARRAGGRTVDPALSADVMDKIRGKRSHASTASSASSSFTAPLILGSIVAVVAIAAVAFVFGRRREKK